LRCSWYGLDENFELFAVRLQLVVWQDNLDLLGLRFAWQQRSCVCGWPICLELPVALLLDQIELQTACGSAEKMCWQEREVGVELDVELDWSVLSVAFESQVTVANSANRKSTPVALDWILKDGKGEKLAALEPSLYHKTVPPKRLDDPIMAKRVHATAP
jgi:hypothetical protein